MIERVKKIFNNVDVSIDVIIIKNSSYPFIDDNFFYVTGLEKGIYENSYAFLFPNGDIELAIANYQKSLEINPDNENGAKYLKQLLGEEN